MAPTPERACLLVFQWTENPSSPRTSGWAGASCPHTPTGGLKGVISSSYPREKFQKPPQHIIKHRFARKNRVLIHPFLNELLNVVLSPLLGMMNHILRKYNQLSESALCKVLWNEASLVDSSDWCSYNQTLEALRQVCSVTDSKWVTLVAKGCPGKRQAA